MTKRVKALKHRYNTFFKAQTGKSRLWTQFTCKLFQKRVPDFWHLNKSQGIRWGNEESFQWRDVSYGIAFLTICMITSMLFSCFSNFWDWNFNLTSMMPWFFTLTTRTQNIQNKPYCVCLFFQHPRHASKSALTLELRSVGDKNKTRIEKIDVFVRIALLCRGVNSILLRTAITLKSLFRVNWSYSRVHGHGEQC